MTLLAFLNKLADLALIIVQDIPPEARADFWDRYNDRMERWHQRLGLGDEAPTVKSEPQP